MVVCLLLQFYRNSVLCSRYQMAKGHCLPFDINEKREKFPLDSIHCDSWGSSPIASHDGYIYYALFIDDHSRFTWLYPLRTKSEFHKILDTYIKFVQNQFSRKIRVFQCDEGTEFVNHNVKRIFDENGTFHRLSCPYTPQQNGRTEGKHRHIVDTGLAMLFNGQVPPQYCVEAFSSVLYIISRLPRLVTNNVVPFEIMFSTKPNYTQFRAFACRVYPYLRDYADHKLSPRSLPCISVDYSSQYKGFRFLDPTTSKVYISRHAQFKETEFPFSGQNLKHQQPDSQIVSFHDEPLIHTPPPPSPTHNSQPQQPNLFDPLPIPAPSIPHKNNNHKDPPLRPTIFTPCGVCIDLETIIPQPTTPTSLSNSSNPSTPPDSPHSTSSSTSDYQHPTQPQPN